MQKQLPDAEFDYIIGEDCDFDEILQKHFKES